MDFSLRCRVPGYFRPGLQADLEVKLPLQDIRRAQVSVFRGRYRGSSKTPLLEFYMRGNSWIVENEDGACERTAKGFAKGLAVVQLIPRNAGRYRTRGYVFG